MTRHVMRTPHHGQGLPASDLEPHRYAPHRLARTHTHPGQRTMARSIMSIR